MKKLLKAGDVVTIDLDPLSHGNDMSILRLTVKILRVDEARHINNDQDVEVDVAVAIYQVLEQQERDYGKDRPLPKDRGGSCWVSEVGEVFSIISIGDGPWEHTHWPLEVDFVDKKKRRTSVNQQERRKQIESSGTVIDDSGVTCDGCLFGIKFSEMCVVDPDGDGPFHYNCAVANCGDPSRVRLAPAEFAVIDVEEFEHSGTIIEKEKEN